MVSKCYWRYSLQVSSKPCTKFKETPVSTTSSKFHVFKAQYLSTLVFKHGQKLQNQK